MKKVDGIAKKLTALDNRLISCCFFLYTQFSFLLLLIVLGLDLEVV